MFWYLRVHGERCKVVEWEVVGVEVNCIEIKY